LRTSGQEKSENEKKTMTIPTYSVRKLSSRTAYNLRKPHSKSNISYNILQNNFLEMSHNFVLAHKIVGNIF
jgi:hypothetical protein